MKHLILTILLLCTICVHAEKQDSIGKAQFCCVYHHKIKTTDLGNKEVKDSTIAILEVGENIAKYGDYYEYDGKKPDGYSSGYLKCDPRSYDGITVYTNYPENGKTTIREALLPNFYVYEEQIPLKWQIVKGKTNILGYKCKKAVVKYAGRTWTAYYTEEIPSANGPWKLKGLPGLILSAESEDGVHKFVAQIIFNVDEQKISLKSDEKDVMTKRDKFVQLRNRLKCDGRWAKNAAYYLNKTDIRGIAIISENNKYGIAPGMTINKISIPTSGGFEHLFKPLELE